METHAAQDVKMVLMHAGQYPLADGGECAFVVGQKDCLNEGGYIHPDNDVNGWENCERRSWCNNDYKNAIPPTLLTTFRPMAKDTFSLAAEREIRGSNPIGNPNADSGLFLFDYYKISTNRIKRMNGTNSYHWNKTPSYDNDLIFCATTSSGAAGSANVYSKWGLAPFGCIGKKVV